MRPTQPKLVAQKYSVCIAYVCRFFNWAVGCISGPNFEIVFRDADQQIIISMLFIDRRTMEIGSVGVAAGQRSDEKGCF